MKVVTWSISFDPRALLLFERVELEDKNQLLKKRQERNLRTEGNTTVFLYVISLNLQGFYVLPQPDVAYS